ncbi:OB-fold nucleic acid binding domain-containing protein [Sinomonas susongensis]|uniref:OB-fold nucleic acid binding domain-containing protein n=1 Tax=Sinomonas susongensis TaxID=1324851 RepID=UPI001FE4ED36|nr:OB-fold nucleic acid binding domain-containing protein [Sinomonas susongensis]
MAERSAPAPLDFSRLPERGQVAGEGTIRSVTFVAPSETPRFTAMIEDGQAERPGRGPAIRLLWLGRRRIRGIDAGTPVRFSGMLSTVDGEPTIYNPRYEILAKED